MKTIAPSIEAQRLAVEGHAARMEAVVSSIENDEWLTNRIRAQYAAAKLKATNEHLGIREQRHCA